MQSLPITQLNQSGDPRLPGAGALPLVVKPREARTMLACGVTRLYELINNNELESYQDGRSRKITVRSIEAYVARKLKSAQAA